MAVALYSHPHSDLHRMTEGHPERPERTTAILDHFRQAGLLDEVEPRRSPPVNPEALHRTHDPAYLRCLYESEPAEGLVPVDADTILCPGTLTAAELAAGALEDAVTRVLSGEFQRAFCAGRPPGHHAEYDAAMGFCFFNNVAVAATTALEDPAVERVAILDFDVHHGNGTVDIFEKSPEVLVCSSFQHPFYPNRHHDTAGDHLVHTPLPAFTGGCEFRKAIERDWLPAITRHRPQLILVSAGFDAHRHDPLGQLDLDEGDFTWITELIVSLANEHARGRIVSTLEGGYDLAALARSAAAHLEALLG